MSYRDAVIADTPLSYWRLEETSGDTVADEQDVREGTVVGANLDVAGQVGSAAEFDGVDDSIAVGSTPETMGTVTVEAIAKYVSSTGDGGQLICADEGGVSTDERGWQFRVRTTSKLLEFTKIANGVVSAVGTTNLDDGLFHHLVGTYDGTTVRVYVDGSEEANNGSTGDIITQARNIRIGRNSRGGGSEFFGGVIDEPAFYDYALTAARIQAHYDAAFAAGVVGPFLRTTGGYLRTPNGILRPA